MNSLSIHILESVSVSFMFHIAFLRVCINTRSVACKLKNNTAMYSSDSCENMNGVRARDREIPKAMVTAAAEVILSLILIAFLYEHLRYNVFIKCSIRNVKITDTNHAFKVPTSKFNIGQ